MKRIDASSMPNAERVAVTRARPACGPAILVLVATALAPAVTAHEATSTTTVPAVAWQTIALPPAGALPDYQLGGAYPPPAGVGIVGRDRNDPPAPGRYSICYINGFQTQPGELALWPPETILRDGNGNPVGDPDWPGEYLLDTSTAARRAQILTVVEPWIAGCASAGFQAVEFDNLDSYTRSQGRLSRQDNTAMAQAYVTQAHAAGLAAAQKNSAEESAWLKAQAGFDFAVSEECAVWQECADYTDAYGAHVIDIEYSDNIPPPFATLCDQNPELRGAMVLRDRDLVTPAQPAYVFETCDPVVALFADGFESH